MDAINYPAIVRTFEVVMLESITLGLWEKHDFFFFSLLLVLQIYITGQDLRGKKKPKTHDYSKRKVLLGFKRN